MSRKGSQWTPGLDGPMPPQSMIGGPSARRRPPWTAAGREVCRPPRRLGFRPPSQSYGAARRRLGPGKDGQGQCKLLIITGLNGMDRHGVSEQKGLARGGSDHSETRIEDVP